MAKSVSLLLGLGITYQQRAFGVYMYQTQNTLKKCYLRQAGSDNKIIFSNYAVSETLYQNELIDTILILKDNKKPKSS